MIRVAICDDDKRVCSQIEATLLKYSDRQFLKTEISVFYSGQDFLRYLNQGHHFDLIYLDIEMAGKNGIEVDKYIRKILKDYHTEIVYISGKDEYDRQLFDVQPMHFIPKPINPNIVIEDFKLALERSQKMNAFFKYQKGNDTFKLVVRDIMFFESLNREIRVVYVSGEDSFYGNLDDIFQRIAEFAFIRIHRSYIINYNQVIQFKYDSIIMANGETLPISRAKRAEIRALQLEEE